MPVTRIDLRGMAALVAMVGLTLAGALFAADAGARHQNQSAGKSAKPAPPSGAERVESFKLNLDKKGKKERVFVYSIPENGFPAVYFEVWKRAKGNWRRGQVKMVTAVPNTNPEYGLKKAWVSDLNRDHKVEIAVRSAITPSVGESLSIYRQKSARSLKFRGLQGIGGDQVKVKPKRGKSAAIKVFRLSNHSPDNVEHHELWKWSKKADQWRCREDCATGFSASAG